MHATDPDAPAGDSPNPSSPFPASPQAVNPPEQPAVLQSAELLQGAREVRIEHNGEFYRLLVTRNGKLLLQK